MRGGQREVTSNVVLGGKPPPTTLAPPVASLPAGITTRSLVAGYEANNPNAERALLRDRTSNTSPPLGRVKGRGGRPALDPAERRTARVEVFLNAAEFAALAEAAAAVGMSVPAFLRATGLRRRIRIPAPLIDRKTAADLGHIRGYLYRLSYAANRGQSVNVDPAELARLEALCTSVAEALRTVEDHPRSGYEAPE
jgi:hypothetical protein